MKTKLPRGMQGGVLGRRESSRVCRAKAIGCSGRSPTRSSIASITACSRRGWSTRSARRPVGWRVKKQARALALAHGLEWVKRSPSMAELEKTKKIGFAGRVRGPASKVSEFMAALNGDRP
jgi:hypothetical protein